MSRAIRVEEATVGGPATLLGRPSSTREEWEAAREADAADLNRLLEGGGEIGAYVVPVWSNEDIERCLRELRGFDDTRVYLELPSGEGQNAALATIAESEWAGAAYHGDEIQDVAHLIHQCAGLEIPLYLEHPRALVALALALGEDLSPREIEAVLQGDKNETPDADSLDHARELLSVA